MLIRPPRIDERGEWLRFRERLWPGTPGVDLRSEQDAILADPERAGVLLATTDDGTPIGFVEVSLRSSAEGCETSPVGYIEAWYVEPEHRRRGVGAMLLAAAEAWAAARGCREMGSDAEIWNEASLAAHRACGYDEVMRVVMLRKRIDPGPRDASRA